MRVSEGSTNREVVGGTTPPQSFVNRCNNNANARSRESLPEDTLDDPQTSSFPRRVVLEKLSNASEKTPFRPLRRVFPCLLLCSKAKIFHIKKGLRNQSRRPTGALSPAPAAFAVIQTRGGSVRSAIISNTNILNRISIL